MSETDLRGFLEGFATKDGFPYVVAILQILEDMKAAEVEYNALTHSLMVESFVVQNQPQAAVDAFFEAQAAGKAVRPETFEKMVARCERSGSVDLMASFWGSPHLSS